MPAHIPAPTQPVGRFQPPDVRRRQILDAVAALLLEDGYEALTVSKVAARAGVAKGTVYLYFDSKQELLAALQAQMWERMLEHPASLLGLPDLNWTDRLDGLVAAWVAAEQDHHELYHRLFHERGASGEEPLTAARDLLVTILAAGHEAGEFDVPDPELTADFLTHAYAGPCHHHAGTDLTPAIQALFRRVVAARTSTEHQQE
ncbi:TetR/AcrR family transcriptional regulator [Rhodococcus maanshanensis]|uniref:DNA-binding transcriptional regulator, AcrR family n=1 Tax=Rhodococcus maanshanensis TaxID=183556 RepID=A0A1H7G1E0_9NOCA|nr:TetR/AcrR family transcriptional regulator [Rhodococcus maanshanensis]SEK31928.1 DNA-binding transcriptional regulator, AcrR family [Rhodococcus maanshanensis]